MMACLFDPMKNIFSPQCQFRLLTGWSCPGCGVQRAFHAFAHGRIAEALSYNYFLVACVPYVVALLMAEVLKWLQRGNEFIRAVQHPVIARVYIIMFFLWWIIRNLLQV